MSFQQGAPKKPRLSLKIKTSCEPAARPRPQVDPSDPTAFNTLSNAYVTAIERSTPLTAINTLQAFSLNTPVEHQDSRLRVHTPFVAKYPETPLSAHPQSPRVMEMSFPSTMAATPPMSGTTDSNESKVFTFSAVDTGEQPQPKPTDDRKGKNRVLPYMSTNHLRCPPYTQPQVLHSILRNSPLPPKTAIPPPSPRRQSLRLQEKAARRVGYTSPLEQTIVTNKYTRSHIDLLSAEPSPSSPSITAPASQEPLDAVLSFTSNEIQDGGQTPGPFEETRRRVTGSTAAPLSPSSPMGIRKRKKKEKKRRWVWTIGQDEEQTQGVGGTLAAMRCEAANEQRKGEQDGRRTPIAFPHDFDRDELPTPSVESSDSAWSEMRDVEMTDSSSVVSEDRASLARSDTDPDVKTPIAPRPFGTEQKRDTPIPELSGSRRDTPVPPEHAKRDTPVPPELVKRDTPIPPEYQN
ncbi:uncharacterized protein J7T54_007230 [Emericellopsis cladophorae]|uniref:Uncharacterized protein n=1 Tax=Emericellopsis cladophorae TaxID=2686198 RepID=A0A9Q0BD23_9HYPO|nr:uncharacterized protein J7T54_007230 [Emericellopsis cladophorae]KAI6780381.1 hypothetical protein J7T54_007230 [Emericellopsis cladophorae]